jgi:hypothetical protein
MKEKRRVLIQEWVRVCENYRKTWLRRKVRQYLETFRTSNIGRSIPDQTNMYFILVHDFGYLDVAEEMIRQNEERQP